MQQLRLTRLMTTIYTVWSYCHTCVIYQFPVRVAQYVAISGMTQLHLCELESLPGQFPVPPRHGVAKAGEVVAVEVCKGAGSVPPRAPAGLGTVLYENIIVAISCRKLLTAVL